MSKKYLLEQTDLKYRMPRDEYDYLSVHMNYYPELVELVQDYIDYDSEIVREEIKQNIEEILFDVYYINNSKLDEHYCD